MNGAELVVESIRQQGIETVFGYPGGAIMPVYDALVDSPLRHILARHEQAAVHAAEGYALAREKPGVVLVTSGPGLTNIVTGLADAYADSVPLVAISGQVARPMFGSDAFQEVDAMSLTMPVVKHSYQPQSTGQLRDALEEAFLIAMEGRRGPVHIDLHKDIALASCPPRSADRGTPQAVPAAACLGQSLETALQLLRASRRLLIYAGGGIHQAGATAEFRQLVERLGAPVVATLKGLGALPAQHPQLLGMMGLHGSERANRALEGCDLLLVVGARFDDRATGKLTEFCPQAKVIHLDIDPSEVGKLRLPDAALVGCLRTTLPSIISRIAPREPHADDSWQPAPAEPPEWDLESPCPRDVLQRVKADIVTTDVGQHQMWAAQFLPWDSRCRLITSGGCGAMGFGLPAAIGAQLARPEASVACITGDGSLMMMIHELATVRRYGLPVKIILFDNSCLGMVRQLQELFLDNRESEVDLSDNPDFLELAAVFGIPGRRLSRNRDCEAAVAEALSSDGPFLLHCRIERQANVWPIVPSGKSNREMILEAVHAT